MATDLSNTTLGFVGCGKIGSAVARGFASCNPPPKSIVVSPRSRDKAEALKAEFPSIVTIAESNDDVVLAADVVFYGLLPGVAREVLPSMPFRKEQLIISMMAAIDYAETLTFSGDVVPVENIVRTVPLPSAAKRSGPILMHPPNARADAVLSCVGTVVACAAEAEMKPMICLTAHISSFFELERVNQQFMEDNGVHKDAAKKFTASFYESLAVSAAASHEGFADLRDEAATPGGLNQQSTDALKAGPHFTAQVASMQVILDRLNGK